MNWIKWKDDYVRWNKLGWKRSLPISRCCAGIRQERLIQITKNLSQGVWCFGWGSSRVRPEYKTRHSIILLAQPSTWKFSLSFCTCIDFSSSKRSWKFVDFKCIARRRYFLLSASISRTVFELHEGPFEMKRWAVSTRYIDLSLSKRSWKFVIFKWRDAVISGNSSLSKLGPEITTPPPPT